MEEAQKEELRQLKAKAVATLRSIAEEEYAALADTDLRLRSYCESVRDMPSAHNLYEILAIVRFFRMRQEYEWDSISVKRFIAFAETVKLSGTLCRRSYPCTPVQVFQYANIWGFRSNGRRLTREVCLFIPRKFSKTTTSAIFASYDIMYGDANAQAYVAANSYNQAQQCFKEIRGIVEGIDPKMRFFHTNRHTVTFRRRERNSFAQCLTANTSAKDGLNASLVIMDEYAQSKSSELLSTLTTSMGVRAEPLTIIITTASDKLFGPFVQLLQGYKKVLRGELEADDVFAHIFEPDIDDEEDKEETWRKVQPHYGVTVRPEFYEMEYQKARRDPNAMNAFRTKLLNIFAEVETAAWISYAQASSLLRRRGIKDLVGNPDAFVSFDLSVRDDFSAVAYTIYDREMRGFHSMVEYYIPSESLDTHPNRELYSQWVADGYLKLCGESVIDYRVIANDILSNVQYMNIRSIGYDAYKSQTCVNILRAAIGYKRAEHILCPVPQTYGHFTSPVDNFQFGAYTGRETLNDNPINVFCITNAVIDIDRMENKKPIKRTQNLKIDGLVCVLMNHWLADHYEY